MKPTYDKLLLLIEAASQSLHSYACGNDSPELAKEVAKHLDKALVDAKESPSVVEGAK